MTSYQKLKERVKELEQANNRLNNDIRALILEPESLRALHIKKMIHVNDNIERQLCFGSDEYNRFKSLLSYVS